MKRKSKQILKKSIGIVLTMAIVMTMVIGSGVMIAYAQDFTLTLKNTGQTEHQFQIYQIFTGDLAEIDGNKVLSNIKWGDGINDAENALGDATTKANTITSPAEADAFAKELVDGGYLTNPIGQTVDAGTDVTITVPEGYYLVRDVEGSQVGDYSAYTNYILEVVGNASAETKLSVPDVVKKVLDGNDSNSSVTDEWKDSADYDIGDSVPFQVTATMPSNIDSYKTYKLGFTDTMSPGLDYNNDVKITLDEADVTSSFDITYDSHVLTMVCNDIKVLGNVTESSKVVAIYSATLNENAVVGSTGNLNKVKLTYSNNPNGDGEGTTPEDINVVFTYTLELNKVDGDSNPLSGAGFTLEKYKAVSNAYIEVRTIDTEGITTFDFKGLDEGNYRLTESKTPSGYNTIEPIYFVVAPVHSEEADSPTVTELAVTIVDENGDPVSDPTFSFTMTKDNTDKNISANIVNNAGSTLPSTGGMGTTILYIAGAIVIIGAVAGFVMMRRRAGEEE